MGKENKILDTDKSKRKKINLLIVQEIKGDISIGQVEPCFIINKHSYSLELAHFVNAIRHDVVQKKEVVRYVSPSNESLH